MSTSTDRPTDDTAADVQRQREAIAGTRADVGRTLEHLEDRVSPTQIKERQKARLRSRWERTKESVMGSDSGDHGAGDRIIDVTDQARDAAHHAPERLEDATRGNPLAAGLIAAGIGALVGSMLPPTRSEQQLSGRLMDEFEEPVRAELRDAGSHMAEELREDARDRMDTIQHTAKDAAEQTKQELGDDDGSESDERQGSGGGPTGSSPSVPRSSPPMSSSPKAPTPPPVAPPATPGTTPPRVQRPGDTTGPFDS